MTKIENAGSLLDGYDFHCHCECFHCNLDTPLHCCNEDDGCNFPTSMEIKEIEKNPLPFDDENIEDV